MPADFTALQASIDALLKTVTDTETVEGSAVTLINGFAATVTTAVTAALQADAAANATTITAAAAAIEGARVRTVASDTALGAAITANTPAAP
jgi:hypothetical protein